MTRQQIVRFVATKFFREFGPEIDGEDNYRRILKFFDSIGDMSEERFVKQMKKYGFDVGDWIDD